MDERVQDRGPVTESSIFKQGISLGGISPQIDDYMGDNWLPVRRFGVLQKDKLRPINDFKAN